MARRWSGVIALEGVQTGDGRVFADGSFYWENLPLPLRWDREDDGNHAGAVTVGTIDRIERRDSGQIWATGTIDDEGANGAEAVRLMEAGMLRGVSIDGDDWQVVVIDTTMTEADLAEADAELMAMFAAAGEPDPGPDAGVVLVEDEAGAVLERYLRVRIRGGTLVDIPAFDEATIALEAGEALTAAVIGARDLPIASRDRSWDGDAARRRLAGDGDEINQERMRAGHFWRDDDADPATMGAYRLPFADVIDGTVTAVPAGIFAVANVLAGGRGGVDIPEADQERIRSAVEGYYARMREQFDDDEIRVPWEEASTAAAGCVDCLTAAGGPDVPPRAWFEDPGLPGPTPLTVDPDTGRVFGHIATWGTCHTGSPAGACVTPPRSASRYAYFRTGVRRCDDGDVPVGQITVGGGHADLQLSYRAAVEHYDNVATAVADVAAGEDAHGIWVAGALRPGVSDDDVRALMAASPSGDWRTVGGSLELVAVHAVNVPGFPVARVASGRPAALVASGALAPRPAPEEPPLDRLGDLVAAAVTRALDERERAPHRHRLAAIAEEHHRDRLRRLA